jgi:hypothetical protein
MSARMTKAAEAIHSEQSRSVNTADDLLPLLHDWLSVHKERQGVELTASEIGASLMMRPGIGNGPKHEHASACRPLSASSAAVSE